MKLNDTFFHLSRNTARHVGHPTAFALALMVIIVWGISGPIFHWSDTWQLIINTGTTIITFLMVFLIQSTQNRDSEALHLKLDELIRATKRARNALIDLDEFTEEEIKALRQEFTKLAEQKRIKQKTKAGERH
jgi:low affinity Fe/Cu permease